MGGVIDGLLGKKPDDSAAREAIAAQADQAAANQRIALANRVRTDSEETMQLAKRPRAGRSGRLLQYFADDLTGKLGG